MTLPTFYAYMLGMAVMGLSVAMNDVWFSAFIGIVGLFAFHFGCIIAARLSNKFEEWEARQ